MNSNENIQAIKQLKYRYFRLLDQKQLDQLAELMLPECTTDYHDGRYTYADRDSLINFLRGTIGRRNLMSMHHGNHPEIELLSDTEARATWYLHDIVIDLEHEIRLEGNGFYEDRYRRVDGHWYFAHTGYKRTFELVQPLGKVLELYNGFEAGAFPV
ncbi:MAG: nuclear transport factor 2 family protein [Oceanospirillaceae bacterium]|nr:nuclear transport factor 2 family protein [Oceanospirillaceae bacterium]